MKSRHVLIAAVGFIGVASAGVCLGGNRPQPAAPPIPPSWKQPPQQQPQPPAQTPSSTDGNSHDSTNKNGKSDPNRHRDRRYMDQSGNPYGYGQPTAGVYYPGSGGVSSSSGNPNAVNPGNTNPPANSQPLFNDAPAPDNSKPAPTVVAPTPPTPPDPELIQATTDANGAMDHLREELLKSNADYQAAVADKKAAQADSATVHAKEDSTPEQILAAATRVLEASRRVVQIERDAAVTDPQVQDAQSKLKTAIAAHSANAAATAAAK